MSSAIHSDAVKESAKGSFGYTDWFLYKFLISRGKPYKREFGIIVGLMFFFAISTAIGPVVLLKAVDRFSSEQTITYGIGFIDRLSVILIDFMANLLPTIDPIWHEVTITAFYYLVIQLVMFVSAYRQRYLLGEVAQKVVLDIRRELFVHLQELDMSYHDKNEVGRIMSRTTSDVQAIAQFIGGQVVQNIVNLATILFAFILMFNINVQLSFVSISLIFPVIIISRIAKKYSRPRRKEARRRNSILMANLGESIAGIKVTKGLAREEQNKARFAVINNDRREAMVRAIDINTMSFPSMLFLAALANAVIVLFGGRLLISGAITAGVLLAFLNYNTILFRPIVILGNFYEQIQDALTGAERVYALLDTKTKVPMVQDKPDLPPIKGKVTFDNVTFEYVPGEPIYKDFTLDIPAGTKVALVGHTGAGKTTIINILSRLYDFQKGKLLIDDMDIRDYSLKSYRDQIAAVPQDFFLFSQGIAENLRLGNPYATEEEMWEVLDKVGLKRYVERLPEGLQTPVQERGGRLSIGQRQLVIFAAILLANPKILILDEATSSIDVFTEIQIQQAMKILLEGRTSFIIAHRLSTIRDADLICVIDDGKIVEMGSHDELIVKNGSYFNLVRNQIELAAV